jgi:PAS domain S-box-containing protein
MPSAPLPQNESSRLAELDRYAVHSTPADPDLDRITKLAAHFFACPIALLSFVEEERQWFKSCIGVDFSEGPRADSFCAWAILGDQVMVVPDASADSRFVDNPLVTGIVGIRFYAGAPLITPRGYKLGTLCIVDTKPRPQGLTSEEKESLASFAALALGVLEARLVARESDQTHSLLERGMAERALTSSEDQFRTTFAKAPLGLVLTHIDGRFIEANEAYRVLTGYSKEEISSVNFISLTHPADIENNRALFQKLVTEEIESYALEKRIFTKQGDLRWVRAHASLLRDADGKAAKVIGLVEDITNRKLADQRFHFLAESIPQMVWTATPDGMLDYVNKPGVQYFQSSQDALLGAGWLDWVHPEDQAKAVERWTNSVKTGDAYEIQFRLKRASDSSWRLHLVRALAFIGEDGKISNWFGTCTDIEDQHQSARAIEEDRQRWRDLLLQTPAAIAVLRGPEHRFEWMNSAYARLVGRSEQALAGKTMREAFPEIEAQVYAKLLNQVYQTGEPFVGREALVQLDRGGVLDNVYLNFVYLPTKNSSGEIDGIFVHLTDVTDMLIARRAIEESESQFRTLAETIPHLAWMADQSGYIFWYNKRWFDYTGTTLQDMQGWGWQSVHDPDVLPEVLSAWARSIAVGEAFEMVFPLKGADGGFRTFLTRVEPVKDGSGNVVRWFGTNTDITDQRRTEEQLRRMNRDLEEFSYVTTHDLQEPLRMVNIYTQLLLGDHKHLSRDKMEKYSEYVAQGVKRMESLLSDLLTFSRNVHSQELIIGTADLSVALNEALSVLKTTIEELGATVTAPALPITRGDTPQMTHVFQNILSNALKYRSADVAPQVRIAARREGDCWIISVSDNGIGFDPRYATRIFGLFQRLHKDEYPGTGLGLAICKRIVERYGGQMWAESAERQGATFFFSLPA